MVGELFSDFDENCEFELRAGILGLLSVEYKIEGAGYGEIMNLMFKALTLSKQQDLVERIISDYNYTNEPRPEGGDEMMEGEMMMEYEPMMDAAMME